MNPMVRFPLPLAPGTTRRSFEGETLLAKRMDGRVKPAYDTLPERTVLQRARGGAELRRSATEITPEQRGFLHWRSILVASATAAWAGRPLVYQRFAPLRRGD
jgi:hypothetical protein